MKAALFFILACFTFTAQAQQTERSMKVELPMSKVNPVFTLREIVTFDLVVITKSVEDQNTLEPLTVDDWRYDEPNYFSGVRVPNVVLHVERKKKDGRWESVPFRASSQGGGANLERLHANVTIEVFPGSSKIQAALVLQLAKQAVAEKKTDEALKKEMSELQKAIRAEALGEFRLTATYTGVSRSGGRVILKAPPIEFKIQETP
ncbi:hypothetical protein [Prosthecobacter sp.]|uniref:hypothetical protein n=1 Tax=Prosthecobacter sp. TaxID=1965333 RepID=UPI0037852E5F